MAATRRLAAILAADVVGYSRLMGADEEGTLARLKALHAEIIDPAIAAHGGRVFKTTGDGLLAEFASVVEAVRCAVSIQQAPLEPAFKLRIGLHVGDVIIDGEDIFGDGVNIAARLEGLAEPGGICISARVYEDVAGRVDAGFDDVGEQSLKNIDRLVRVYKLRSGDAHAGAAPRHLVESPTTPDLRRIGFLGVTPRGIYDEFRRALAAYGYIDGRTVEIVYRWSEGDNQRLPGLASELIDLGVQLIMTTGTPPVLAAKQATQTIPIVMVEVGDPVGYGIVPSLLRPGGNITGMSNGLHEFAPRGLRLFKEIMPEATRVALLGPDRINQSASAAARPWIESMEGVANALGMVTRYYHANGSDQFSDVIAGLAGRTDVIVAAPDHGMLLHRAMIISSALALKIPVVCQQPEFVLDGALLSLDPDRRAVYRRVAYYVDAILKGAKPSELPVEEPGKSWLMINLKTANLLGIEIPGPILMHADQVIE
jgi:class 3 adenylate cyclase/ABC-type uncharacterized transport system substrate-binding protein